MANPYPMQPMGQPQQMGGGGAPPRAQAAKRGTSKAVPVVVSAGLAIGVFCGLLFGLGVEKEEAAAATTSTTSAPKPKTEDVPAPFKPADPPAAPAKPPVAKTVATAGTTGSAGSAEAKPGEKPATGSGDAKTEKPATGSAATTPAAPGKLVGKLTITVKPEAIAKTAKIFIDGKQLDSNTFEVDLTDKLDAKKNEARKTVKVLVKASGYKDIERAVDIVAAPNSENNNSFEVDLPKRAAPPPGGTTNPGNTGTTPNRPPPPGGGTKPPGGGNKPKCKKPPCGLIDI